MRYGSAQLLTNSSMSTTVLSNGVDLQQEWIYAIQANWSGSAIGELKLQASNDNVVVGPTGTNPSVNVVNWATIAGTANSTSVQAGSSSFLWNVQYPGYRWVRVVFTASSGTGTLGANYFGKGA